MTVHVEIDRDACNGYGNCVLAAPEVFDLDPDTNIAAVIPGRPLDSDVLAIEEAAADCPVRAIGVRRR